MPWSKEKRDAYRRNHPEKLAAQKRAWRLANPERVRASKRADYYRHRAKRIATVQARTARQRESIADYKRRWSMDNRRKHTAQRYGLSLDEFDRLVTANGSVCEICHQPCTPGGLSRTSLVVDHDHASGAIRGLLCTNCNRGLGFFKDDPRRLLNAVAYLGKRAKAVA